MEIEYWLTSSKDDLDTANKLYASKKYHHCLFFVHLALEKILKALYISQKQGPPPPIHDLVRLVEKSGVKVSDDLIYQLVEISTFNVAARYDDYKFKFYKKATKEYATGWLKIGEKLYDYFSPPSRNLRFIKPRMKRRKFASADFRSVRSRTKSPRALSPRSFKKEVENGRSG